MVRKSDTRALTEYQDRTEELGVDITDMVIYKERLNVSYQYLDAQGAALNQAPVNVPINHFELFEGQMLLTLAGSASIYDNRVTGAVSVRLLLNSELAPQPTNTPVDAALNSEELQEELTKRDLQDSYTLSQGSAADGSIHGDNLVDGSVRLSKLATNSLGSDALQDGAVTAPKIAAGAVTADKLAAGLLYTPGVSDPVQLSALDVTFEEDDSSVSLPYYGYVSELNVFRKASHDNVGRNGAGVTIGIARSRVGADVRVAVVDGAIVDGFSGLTAGRTYTLNNDGDPAQGSENRVGVAVSNTQMMLKR